MMLWQSDVPRKKYRYVVAAALILLAALLRFWPLQTLGSSLVWLTFYPAVAAAAAYGGFMVGLTAALAASAIAAFCGPLLVNEPFIRSTADQIGLLVFVLNCSLISAIAESMLRAKERARQAQQLAEAANKAKSTFLANMSHELRTPLNAILGFSSMMRNEPQISERQRQTLGLINRSGEHLLGLINDVLDMSKIEAGRIVIENSVFDVVSLLREIADLMRIRAIEKSLAFELSLPEKLPGPVVGDAKKLRQSVINLVGNAIKYTPAGRIDLRLRLESDPTATDRLRLIVEVEDTGIGISPADQGRIFKAFVQVSQLSMQQGTGLGLAITAKQVEAMGGQIHVESTVGEGSLFRIEVPVTQPADASDATTDRPRGRVIRLAPGQDRFRVLIVEDQMENWLLLQRMLEEVGFIVELAENGQQGIERFQSWRPDFIWMDVRMPVIDGLEATQRIRALPGGEKVRIAALTASVFKEERDQVMNAGMDDFVRKPYRADEVFDCMERHLGAQFIRDDHQETAPSTPLTRSSLGKLPADLRTQLRAALLAFDADEIRNAIDHIGDTNSALAGTLRLAADSLAYSSILAALDQSAEHSLAKAEK